METKLTRLAIVPKKVLVASLLLPLFILVNAHSQTTEDKEKILSVLNKQEDAWNRGDIPAFMNGYWNSDSLLFFSVSGISKGYENTLNGYQKRYPNRDAMGTLNFDILEVYFPSESTAIVLGKWHLTRPKAGDVGGVFSLVWKKFEDDWLIISDHTSVK